MVKTIGNPLSWSVHVIGDAAGHVTHSVETIGSHEEQEIVLRHIEVEDLRDVLHKGVEDFMAARADVMFLVLLYPVIGLVLAGIGLQANLLPLLFPLVAGFAILGPVAAVGLYEISRRREMGESVSWQAAFNVLRAPRFGAIVALGLYLVAIFLGWILAATEIYSLTLGPGAPESATAFFTDVFTTPAGWAMIVLGTGVGFIFAFMALVTSVVSFPLLLDRNVGLPVTVVTSWRVFRKNPRTILTWGFIVAVSLALGAIPLLLGLIFALPILGHATWHLYRRAIK